MKGYFDNAATTYKKPDGMYESISQFMQQYGANIGRGNYANVLKSGDQLVKLRKNLLKLVGAPESKTTIITPSATIALNTILFGIDLNDGDTIYISHFEHNAILRPLFEIQNRIKINIKYLPMSPNNRYEFDLAQTEADFKIAPPKMTIISHVSNVLGIIAPVETIAHLSKQYDALVVVDASQSCGILNCSLVNVDYYVFAGHKTLLGPDGIGGFICNTNTKLKPFIFGGTGIDSANKQMPKDLPERFEAGSRNLMAIVGLNYSTEWLLKNMDFLRQSEKINMSKLYDILSSYKYIELISPYPDACSIISCKVAGYTSDEFGNILAERGISTRTGLHCAPDAHRYIKSFPEGLIRFSVSCFTSDEDFILLDQVLHEIADDL